MSNASVTAWKVIINSARVCLAKNQFAIDEFIRMEKFSITEVISQRNNLVILFL